MSTVERICQTCDTRTSPDHRFCPQCGLKFEDATEKPPSPATSGPELLAHAGLQPEAEFLEDETHVSDRQICLACEASLSEAAQYCGRCGSPKGLNEPAQAEPPDAMSTSGSKAPYRRPTIWLLVACLPIAGWTVFARFSANSEPNFDDPAAEMAEAGVTPVNEAPAQGTPSVDPPTEPVETESNVGTPATGTSPTALVQGVYRGALGKQTVTLTFSSDAPDSTLAMARGTATYRFTDGSGCDSAFRAIEQVPSGQTMFEQTSAGQGRDCPKNYPMIATPLFPANAQGNVSSLSVEWLDPDTQKALGKAELRP